MIEVVSYPADLTHWDPTKTPFYLELFGDTSPVLDTHYGEVIKPGPVDGAAQTVAAAPIYEYWWTIGHPGHAPETGHLWDAVWGEEPNNVWERLAPRKGVAARVYLFFPRSGGWRIKELVATAKYLTPLQGTAHLGRGNCPGLENAPVSRPHGCWIGSSGSWWATRRDGDEERCG